MCSNLRKISLWLIFGA
ncbi:Bgt-50198 [Blumeria graminis f. sp. tritici]|uniref:Bgt-50198 n=1 Tax=Blumeria graminis f. sp. tritici TaxID=62690 RepID=A0A9X9MEX8_BLUGR|nr:Bgt-50198 [Blumeria graminis f. sp. tritici]